MQEILSHPLFVGQGTHYNSPNLPFDLSHHTTTPALSLAKLALIGNASAQKLLAPGRRRRGLRLRPSVIAQASAQDEIALGAEENSPGIQRAPSTAPGRDGSGPCKPRARGPTLTPL